MKPWTCPGCGSDMEPIFHRTEYVIYDVEGVDENGHVVVMVDTADREGAYVKDSEELTCLDCGLRFKAKFGALNFHWSDEDCEEVTK